ncbi:hypothetical protein NE237_011212 [Protea cynaroides]|uniref:Pentatricopeptide repeat-containing protein n=1 Tax=Protea cynaroides TaxID=273540 RepID=A0A9Q0GZG4_9MAGN|nr:hypothetical protein NE237_011212 [Protea cynaroides]
MMKSIPMDSLQCWFPRLGVHDKPPSLGLLHEDRFRSTNGRLRPFPQIACGLRKGPPKSLWKSKVLSTEAIQAVHSLKLAKSSSKLEEVFSSRIGRLLKDDLIATLAELQRQNEWKLALKVFHFMRKEVWYKPDLSLYYDMILMLGKNKLIAIAEELFSELKEEGLQPDTRVYTEMIGALFQVGMIEKAMETYGLMKQSGCIPDKLTLTMLIRNLVKAGEEELASTVKKDCAEYVDSPEELLREIETKYSKKRSIMVI